MIQRRHSGPDAAVARSSSAALRARGSWPGNLPALVDPFDLGWTADVGESSDGQALPEMGPRGQAIIDQLLARVTELEFCEHAGGDFALQTPQERLMASQSLSEKS